MIDTIDLVRDSICATFKMRGSAFTSDGPDLARTKDVLNYQFLPLFGSSGQGVSFDADNPVPRDWQADAVINATGTWTTPFWPHYPGRETFLGRQLHTANYRGPAEFAGRRVVVVGGGTSAIQLLTEISDVATTTWVTRRPPVLRDEPFTRDWGRMVVALVDERVRAGLPPGSVVSATGLAATPAAIAASRRRLPMFDRITPTGVAWSDGRFVAADVILWCTGWRPALDHLAPLRLREPGGGIRMDCTRVVAEPRLHLVGYGPSASTVGANRAGRQAVKEIQDELSMAAAVR